MVGHDPGVEHPADGVPPRAPRGLALVGGDEGVALPGHASAQVEVGVPVVEVAGEPLGVFDADDLGRDDEGRADQLDLGALPTVGSAPAERAGQQRAVGRGVDQDLGPGRVEGFAEPRRLVEVRAHVGGLDGVGDEAGGTGRVDVGEVGGEGGQVVELPDQGGQLVGRQVQLRWDVGTGCHEGAQVGVRAGQVGVLAAGLGAQRALDEGGDDAGRGLPEHVPGVAGRPAGLGVEFVGEQPRRVGLVEGCRHGHVGLELGGVPDRRRVDGGGRHGRRGRHRGGRRRDGGRRHRGGRRRHLVDPRRGTGCGHEGGQASEEHGSHQDPGLPDRGHGIRLGGGMA